MVKRIVFIYAANSGLLSALWDSARKVVNSPGACDLCTITHGLLAERGDWKKIEKDLGRPTRYYHRDEIPPSIRGFLREKEVALPVVLLEADEGSYRVAADDAVLKECRGDPNCLKEQLERALTSQP